MTTQHRAPRRPPAPTLVLWSTLALGAGFVWSQARRMWFTGDDWSFLLHRDLSWSSVMAPHNEHWSALPVLWFRLLHALVGLDHYDVWAMAPVALHLVAALLAQRLMVRNELARWPATLVVLPFIFLAGDIGENPLWDFQVGFLGSAVCGLGALLFVSRPEVPLRSLMGAWSLSLAGLACSGMGLPMLAWLGARVLFSRGWRAATLAVLPQVGVYAAWFLQYGRAADSIDQRPTAGQFVQFLLVAAGHGWGEVFRGPFVLGLVVLAGLVLAAVLVARLGEQRVLALSGLVALAALLVVVALSRASLGTAAARVGRYDWFVLLFSLPAAAAAVEGAGRRWGRTFVRQGATGAVVGLLAVNGVLQTLSYADTRAAATGELKGRLAGALALLESGEPLLSTQVDPATSPDISTGDLTAAVRAELPAVPLTRRGLLAASSTLQVASAATPWGLPPAQDLRLRGLAGPALRPSGCTDMVAIGRARLDLPPTESGTQVELRVEDPTLLARLVDGDLTSPVLRLGAAPGAATYVATTSSVGTLQVFLRRGPVRVCLTTR